MSRRRDSVAHRREGKWWRLFGKPRAKAADRNRVLSCEPLEMRQLLTAAVYIAPGSDLSSVAWSPTATNTSAANVNHVFSNNPTALHFGQEPGTADGLGSQTITGAPAFDREYVWFDLSGLPANAEIDDIYLNVQVQYKFTGSLSAANAPVIDINGFYPPTYKKQTKWDGISQDLKWTQADLTDWGAPYQYTVPTGIVSGTTVPLAIDFSPTTSSGSASPLYIELNNRISNPGLDNSIAFGFKLDVDTAKLTGDTTNVPLNSTIPSTFGGYISSSGVTGSAGATTYAPTSLGTNGPISRYGLAITYHTNDAPNAPVNSPALTGATLPRAPTLISSGFSDPNDHSLWNASSAANPTGLNPGPIAEDIQTKTEWQIARDSGFNNIVWDYVTTGTSLSQSYNSPQYTPLDPGTVYWWRHRQMDGETTSPPCQTSLYHTNRQTNLYSNWSLATWFQTTSNSPLATVYWTDPTSGPVAIASGLSNPSAANGTDFGTYALNDSSSIEHFRITNMGVGNLDLSGFQAPSGFTVVAAPPAIIAAGSSGTFALQLSTIAAGFNFGYVSFNSDDYTHNPYSFAIQGRVTGSIYAGAHLTVKDSSGANYDRTVMFADTLTPGGTSSPQTFSLVNDGSSTLNIANYVFGGASPADFGIVVSDASNQPVANPGGGFTIAPGTTYTVQSVFQPQGTGYRAANISFTTTPTTPAVSLFMAGSGIGPLPGIKHFDFGTIASPIAVTAEGTSAAQVTAATAYSAQRGYGWEAGGTIFDWDRQIGTPLTRDFNYTQNGTFRVDLPNGTYGITLDLGETVLPHAGMNVYLQQQQVDSVTTTTAAPLVSKTYTVTVTGGYLEVGLKDSNTTLYPAGDFAVICGMDVVPSMTRLDFGPVGSAAVAPGYLAVSPNTLYSPSTGYGWESGAIFGTDRGGNDLVGRDFDYTTAGTFAIDLPDPLQRLYNVTLTLGDPWYAHDKVDIYINGNLVEGNLTTAAGQIVRRTYTVALAAGDTRLTIDFVKESGATDPNICVGGLEISPANTNFDFGTANSIYGNTASPVAPGFNPVYASTAYTPDRGYGWLSGSVSDWDRGSLSDRGLTNQYTSPNDNLAVFRDFNYTTNATFAVDLTNTAQQVYDVSLSLGDVGAHVHDGMVISFEGGTQPGSVTTDAGQIVTKTYRVMVTDGQLDVGLLSTGADRNVVIESLEIRPVLQFDFGTTQSTYPPNSAAAPGISPVAPGFNPVYAGTRYSPAQGYGWTSGVVFDADRGTISAGSNDLTRDFIYSTDATLAVNLSPSAFQTTIGSTKNTQLSAGAVYYVTLSMGDPGPHVHDNMQVIFEGNTAAPYTVTTGLNSVVRNTYRVVVTDGQLNIEFKGAGGDPNVVVEGLEIIEAPATNIDFNTTAPDVALTATGYIGADANTLYNPVVGYGWQQWGAGTIAPTSADRGTANGADNLTRDFNQVTDGTFLVDVPNGSYSVRLYVSDYNGSSAPYSFQVTANDQSASIATATTSTAAPYIQTTAPAVLNQVHVTNGQLAIHLFKPTTAGATDAIINGIDIFNASITPTQYQLAAGGALAPAVGTPVLSSAQLQPIVAAAIDRWQVAGLSAAAVQALHNVQFAIADLPGGALGQETGSTVIIDQNAAGYGWFVDPTPQNDAEYAGRPGAASLTAVAPQAVDRMDLLSVVSHELGHSLGLSDVDAGVDQLMSETLPAGLRRVPTRSDVDAVFATGSF